MYEYNTKYQATCPECGKIYFKIKSYYRMCPTCYREQNPRPSYTPNSQKSSVSMDMTSIIEQLTTVDKLIKLYERKLLEKAEEIQRLRLDNKEEVEYWKHKYYVEANKPQSTASVPFTPEMIKNLIRLCHPDKHDNNRMSNEITQFLLTLRK